MGNFFSIENLIEEIEQKLWSKTNWNIEMIQCFKHFSMNLIIKDLLPGILKRFSINSSHSEI